MGGLSDIGIGLKKYSEMMYNSQTPEAEFKRKYQITLNAIRLAEKRLNGLMKNGGGHILSNKYYLDVKKELEKLASSCQSNSYKENLEGYLDFLTLKIDLLTSSSAKASFDAMQTAASEYQKLQMEEISRFQDKMIQAYNNAGSNIAGDSSKVKSKALEDEYQKLKKKIQTDDTYVVRYYVDDKLVVDEGATASRRAEASKQLEKAYESAKEGVKAAEDLAEQNAKKVMAVCEKSMTLPDLEKANDISRQLELAMQQAAAELAKLPDEIIDAFKEIENFLLMLVTGFGDLNFLAEKGMVDVTMMVDEMINQLQSILDPVFTTATALKLPLPPILAPIKDLLQMLPQMGKDPPALTPEQKALIEKFKKSKVQIPDDWKVSIKKMKDTINTVMTLLPCCLIQVIFNMINAIVGQILSLGGAAPYPLNLLPLAITFMPKVYSLIMTFPQTIEQIIERKIKDMVAQTMALGTSFGSSIDGIMTPTPSCPEAVKAELQKKIEAERKAKEQQQALKEAQEKQQQEKKIKAAIEARAKNDELYKKSEQYKKDLAEAANQAERLSKINANKVKAISDKEAIANKEICQKILNEAQAIMPNNTDDQPVEQSEDTAIGAYMKKLQSMLLNKLDDLTLK